MILPLNCMIFTRVLSSRSFLFSFFFLIPFWDLLCNLEMNPASGGLANLCSQFCSSFSSSLLSSLPSLLFLSFPLPSFLPLDRHEHYIVQCFSPLGCES